MRDLPIYYVGTPGPRAVIVLPEVFGWAGRLKAICDTLAAEGFFVAMPDIHRGETLHGQPDPMAWLAQTPWLAADSPRGYGVEGDMAALLGWLRERGAQRIGAAGFCWGAWVLSKASASGVPLSCGVGLHPSTGLEERAFGGSELEMVGAVQMPILLLPAGNDPAALKPGGSVVAALSGRGGGSYEYPDMQHGWVTRGDVGDPTVRRDVEDAVRRMIGHLRDHL